MCLYYDVMFLLLVDVVEVGMICLVDLNVLFFMIVSVIGMMVLYSYMMLEFMLLLMWLEVFW